MKTISNKTPDHQPYHEKYNAATCTITSERKQKQKTKHTAKQHNVNITSKENTLRQSRNKFNKHLNGNLVAAKAKIISRRAGQSEYTHCIHT